MTSEGTKVYDRIRAAARAAKTDVEFAFRKFAFERFMARLEASEWAGRYAVKGGMLMLSLPGGMPRPTDDLDLSADAGMDMDGLVRVLSSVASMVPEREDGLSFALDVPSCHVMRIDSVNPTVRATIDAVLAHAYGRTAMRLKFDVSEGDDIHPGLTRVRLPASCRGFEPPELPCYPWETVVAEKLHAIVQHGASNTRMRDYFDLISISRHADLDVEAMARAVAVVFGSRDRPVETEPFGLTAAFAASKETEWKRLLARKSLNSGPKTMAEAVAAVRCFAVPVLSRAAALRSVAGPKP